MQTHPAEEQDHEAIANHVLLTPFVDGADGSRWAHKDYQLIVAPWAVEAHIGPPESQERFGDLESWSAYVKAQDAGRTFITWNGKGLRAVLDYHTAEQSGRCKRIAEYSFVQTPEWRAWTGLQAAGLVDQRRAVETLDERLDDIKEPAAATVMNVLRNLRGNVTSRADVHLREDGTSAVTFSRETNVRGGAGAENLELPAQITISVPVIRGHVNDEGEIVRYRFDVKLRADVKENGQLGLRFTILAAETALEEVYAELLFDAKAQLGDTFSLYRAAD